MRYLIGLVLVACGSAAPPDPLRFGSGDTDGGATDAAHVEQPEAAPPDVAAPDATVRADAGSADSGAEPTDSGYTPLFQSCGRCPPSARCQQGWLGAICFQECSATDECPTGYECTLATGLRYVLNSTTGNACLPRCVTDADCPHVDGQGPGYGVKCCGGLCSDTKCP